VGDGPVDGSGSAIFGQQRSVEIDPAEFGDGKKTRRDDLTVSDDDNGVGCGAFQNLLGFRSADFLGLVDGNPGIESSLFDR